MAITYEETGSEDKDLTEFKREDANEEQTECVIETEYERERKA